MITVSSFTCGFAASESNAATFPGQSDDVIGHCWRNDFINYHFVLLMPVNTAYLPLCRDVVGCEVNPGLCSCAQQNRSSARDLTGSFKSSQFYLFSLRGALQSPPHIIHRKLRACESQLTAFHAAEWTCDGGQGHAG